MSRLLRLANCLTHPFAILCALSGLVLATPCAAATYSYTSPTYPTINNFTSCGTPPCNGFQATQRLTATVITSAPLAANLTNQNVMAAIQSYTVSDGVHTFSSTDPQVRLIYPITATTNASGTVTQMGMVLLRWRTPGSTHVVGDRMDYTDAAFTTADNVICNTVVAVAPSGVADACTNVGQDTSSSMASTGAAGTWTVSLAAQDVPTLGDLARLILAGLLGLGAWHGLRRQTTGRSPQQAG